jgi:hypothetical protein
MRGCLRSLIVVETMEKAAKVERSLYLSWYYCSPSGIPTHRVSREGAVALPWAVSQRWEDDFPIRKANAALSARAMHPGFVAVDGTDVAFSTDTPYSNFMRQFRQGDVGG